MREFFGSLKFKIFALIACLLIGLMLRTVSTGKSTITQNVVGVAISPFQTASAYISDAVSGFIDNIMNLSSLQTQNVQLKKQISKLNSQIVDYDDVKRENEQLRGLVDITQESQKSQYAIATVISRGPNQWFSSFTIDKGTLNGIKTNDPVETADGLVGIVVSTMPTTSVVSTILDPSVHAGCSVSQTGDTGITQGDSQLAAKGEFELAYLTKSNSVTTGNIIVTTGEGGIYPKGLNVGIVQELEPDISGNSVNAICTPTVDPSSVKDVFIITNFSGKQTSSGTSSSSGGK